uniref:Endonuclease domain-containing 1 protein-like n=1 Tax=Phallusia mammillata TaxID=59560 RepID=A0A6F9DCI8_9ASCI|nr:endonuclease domain-containing 1 protein-like [Phallusia mammillata]
MNYLFTVLFTCLIIAVNARKEVYDDENLSDYHSYSVNCDEFFHGKAWPMPVGVTNQGLVKLCQNQKRTSNVTVFATLFSTKERIPVYTANRVVLSPDGHEYPRPESYLWTRVSLTLCDIDVLPTKPIPSMIGHIAKHLRETCADKQALSEDYLDNDLDLDRGHLSPNSINSQNLVKQDGTFTLTNAAPQFSKFNSFSWREFECVTQQTILELVPNEAVYVMTGTYGQAYDESHNPLFIQGNESNPVKVPGFYWKAVCYPGNSQTGMAPWGYAIIQQNVNIVTKASYTDYLLLKDFAAKYFIDPPFGEDCMNASFGTFQKYLNEETYDQFLSDHCNAYNVYQKQPTINRMDLR